MEGQYYLRCGWCYCSLAGMGRLGRLWGETLGTDWERMVGADADRGVMTEKVPLFLQSSGLVLPELDHSDSGSSAGIPAAPSLGSRYRVASKSWFLAF